MPPKKPRGRPQGRKRPTSNLTPEQQALEEIRRIRMPRPPEVFGIVEQRVGGSRMIVRCLDGITRNCRIPGRLKKRLWVREGDLVIIVPWEFSGATKGDVLVKYRPNQYAYLKQKGYLRKLEDLEEF